MARKLELTFGIKEAKKGVVRFDLKSCNPAVKAGDLDIAPISNLYVSKAVLKQPYPDILSVTLNIPDGQTVEQQVAAQAPTAQHK